MAGGKEVKHKIVNWTLMNAAHDGRLSQVLDLLSKGECDIDKQTPRGGKTALHSAANQRQWAVCRVLLEAGWTSTVRDKYGETPIHLVAPRQAAMDVHFTVIINF